VSKEAKEGIDGKMLVKDIKVQFGNIIMKLPV
jgi:hypothetical protein